MEQVFVDKMTEGTRELGIAVVGEADWSSFIAIMSCWLNGIRL